MRALITGSSGLIGSEAVAYFGQRGAHVHGIDNNMRRDFFGPGGDTRPVLERLREECPSFQHYGMDVRDRAAVIRLFKRERFDLVIHCAAQPSHDLAASRPFDDFEVNAVGTLNLLEATRQHCPEATFIFMSTNKVYGDAPNELPLVELDTRWDYAREEDHDGIDESCRIDASMHSLFGVSKAAADLMVQEYGRYFGMHTACFRGGCLTGPNHRGVELHGFLAYLIKCGREGIPYTIIGYKGKQVRDQIHSLDVCRAMEAFHGNPRCGEVYNLGGGRANSVSVLEAVARVEQMFGTRMQTSYREQGRLGDHVCYITDLSKFRRDYPRWNISVSLDKIFENMLSPEPATVA
jgi:CDP-paratose 2-epimerase